jgi:hypothetical protein
MKIVIESDGTLEGTTLDFHMAADEIPKLVERQRRKQLKRVQPPDVSAPPVVRTVGVRIN